MEVKQNNIGNDKGKTENKTESRLMNFFNQEFYDRKLDFKPKKPNYKEVINKDIKELFPETLLLDNLFKIEEDIDEAVHKTRLRVQEKLMKPSAKINTKLNCHLFGIISSNDGEIKQLNLVLDKLLSKLQSNNLDEENNKYFKPYDEILDEVLNENNLEHLYWTVKFQGKLEISSCNQKDLSYTRKFSYFFSKIIFKFENYPGSPKISDIEWSKQNNLIGETEGFEIKRSFKDGIPKSVKILYYLNSSNIKFKLINKDLSSLLGIKIETRSKVLYNLWQYIKINNLLDKDNNSIVINNKYLYKIFKVERMELNSLPNRLINFLKPLEVIENPPVVGEIFNHNDSFPEVFFDIDVTIDDPGYLNIMKVMTNLDNETLLFPKSIFMSKSDNLKVDKTSRIEKTISQINDYDKNITELIDKLNKYKYKYDFFNEYSKDPIRFIENFQIQQDSLLRLIKDELSVIETRFDYSSSKFYSNYEDILKDSVDYYINSKSKQTNQTNN